MKMIESSDIRELVENYGSPLYVYSQNRIIENYQRMSVAFQEYYPKTHIHYAMKANSNPHILKILRNLGAHVECSSPGEIFIAKSAGFLPNEILYTGNYESHSDLKYALDEKVSLNLDDENSFRRLCEFPLPEELSFRVNPGMGSGAFEEITTGGEKSKFGIPYEKAYSVFKQAKEKGVKKLGIHMMAGSNNLDSDYFPKLVDQFMKIYIELFSKLEMQASFIDIGSGFGIPYSKDEEALDIKAVAKSIAEIIQKYCTEHNFDEPYLFLEPGRYFVADAGFLLSKVTGVKKSYQSFVGLDAGMGTLIRPALYKAKHDVAVYGKETAKQKVNICGQICENTDIFFKGLDFPDVEENDIVIIKQAGAYAYAMASSYNGRLKPAEVLIDGKNVHLIRRRERFEDLISDIV